MRLNTVLPPEAIGNVPRIWLTGHEKLLIEGHKGLLACTPDLMTVYLPSGKIAVHGANLIVVTLSTDDLSIAGKISKLEFIP